MKKLFILFILFISCDNNGIEQANKSILWNPELYDFVNGYIYNYDIDTAFYIEDGEFVHFEMSVDDITTIGNPSGLFIVGGLPGILQAEEAADVFMFSTGTQIYEVQGRITNVGGSPIILFYLPSTVSALSSLLFEEGDIRISGNYIIQ